MAHALAQMEHNSGHGATGNHNSVRRFSVSAKSVFIFSCLCGREFQKEQKEAFHCPDCGRLLVLEWHVEDAVPNVRRQQALRFAPTATGCSTVR